MFNGGTVPAQRYISHYLRRTFTVTNAPGQRAHPSVLRDDGVVVYVNGVEVAATTCRPARSSNTTFAVNAQFDAAESTLLRLRDPARAAPVEGTNVLAVSVHNESRQGAGDLSFDARLSATTAGAACAHERPPDGHHRDVRLARMERAARPRSATACYRDGTLVGSPATNTFADTGLTSSRPTATP